MKKSYYTIVSVLFLSLISFFSLEAQDLVNSQSAASDFYFILKGEAGQVKSSIILNREEDLQHYVFNFENGGYIMVSGKTNHVVAFSEVDEYKIKGSENNIVRPLDLQKTDEISNSILHKGTSHTSKGIRDQIDPFLSDIWGGVNCKDDKGNSVYPSNYYTPDHCSPGCVAISMSQVLHFYEWPKIGMGNNVYSDNYNSSIKRHAAFFDHVEYDWDNMLDEYMNKSSNDLQQRAVGELMYHTDVALQMDFEPSGSTSNIDKTPFVYENFFRFTSHYKDVTWTSFWSKLKENVQAGYPVPVAVDASRTGDGHVFVVNGYKEVEGNPYYYLNWGWYGTSNGWYNIQEWTNESPGYNTITGAAFDVLPNPQITSIDKTGSGNGFTINWQVSDKINWDEFTLEHKIDQGDWEEVASGINSKNYTVTDPVGKVYQFRVKSKIDGIYRENSWSEIEVFAVEGDFDGYGNFGGDQYAYARQTPEYHLNFTGDYTFETWIRLKDSNVNSNVILDQRDVFTLEISEVNSSDYSVKFKSYSSNAELNSNKGDVKLQNDKWQHIAITHSGDKTRLFVNGTLTDKNTGSNFNLISSNNALNIGEKYHGSYSSLINADLDQIRISSTSRYNENFTPDKKVQFKVDKATTAYFNFQNVHKVRLKDKASNLSVIVKNELNFVEWKFEETGETLANEDFELIKSSLSIFPNPMLTNSLNISLENHLNLENIEINVFDLSGRKVKTKSISNSYNKWVINLDNVNSGIYILQIKGDYFTASRKIIKK